MVRQELETGGRRARRQLKARGHLLELRGAILGKVVEVVRCGTAPWQELSDILHYWSDAVRCPADAAGVAAGPDLLPVGLGLRGKIFHRADLTSELGFRFFDDSCSLDLTSWPLEPRRPTSSQSTELLTTAFCVSCHHVASTEPARVETEEERAVEASLTRSTMILN